MTQETAQPTERPTVPSPPRSESERREHHRKQLRAALMLWARRHSYTGYTQDISAGGLFAATGECLPVGSRVDLELELPGGHKLQVRGVVKWVRDPPEAEGTIPGMGIQFEALALADHEAVCAFVSPREPVND